MTELRKRQLKKLLDRQKKYMDQQEKHLIEGARLARISDKLSSEFARFWKMAEKA